MPGRVALGQDRCQGQWHLGRMGARNHPSWPQWCPRQPSSGDAHGSTTEPRPRAARRCVGWEQQRSEQPVCFSLAALGRSCGKNSFKQQSWKGKGWAGGRGEGPRWGRGRRARRGAGKGLGGRWPVWVRRQGRGQGPHGGIPFPREQLLGSSSTHVCWCVLLCARVHGAGEPRVCAHTRWCEHCRGGDRTPGGSSQHQGRFSRFWGRREAPSRLRNRVSVSFDERRQVPRTRAGGEQGKDRRELGPVAPAPWHCGLSPMPWRCQGGTGATRPLPRAGNRQR